MTTGQLIDLELKHHVNAGAIDVNSATQRERALELTQETAEQVWVESDWDFKKKTTTLSLTSATDAVDAPSDFDTFGEGGGLYITVGSASYELEYQSPADLFARREYNTGSTGCPEAYTIAQQDTDYNVQIIFDRVADTTYSLRAYYDSTCPQLMDRPLAPSVATAAPGGLGIEGDYIYLVVFVAADGSESQAGTASATISPSGGGGFGQDVVVTNIPLGNATVVTRKLYRTHDGGSDYFLLHEFTDDNTTTTFTDDILDGSLTEALTASQVADSLSRFPRDFHRNVLLKGVIARLAASYGDGRKAEFDADFERALGQVKARRQHGLETLERIGSGGLPRFGMH